MTDKPIIFSGPMVQALLDGRKTQTRRVLKPQFPSEVNRVGYTCFTPAGSISGRDNSGNEWFRKLPIATGDRLWVREQCATWEGSFRHVAYRADMTDKDWSDLSHDARNGAPWKRRTSIHMPRWASRLTLTVTDVRVQRLQDISNGDAICEGVQPNGKGATPIDMFRTLWNSIHGSEGWADNPWIVAYTFTVQRGNIDEVTA